jgi:integrative and conjugative element protein (TIGR02256 family)
MSDLHQRLTFRRRSEGLVVLHPRAVDTLLAYQQNEPTSHEAGGVLLGRLILNSHNIIIDSISEPNTQDRASRTRFNRARTPTQQLINRDWATTNGAINYLGEWHTHPQPSPEPSPEDLKNWQLIFRDASFEQDFLLFLIVGTSTMRLWEYKAGVCLSLQMTQ